MDSYRCYGELKGEITWSGEGEKRMKEEIQGDNGKIKGYLRSSMEATLEAY